MTEITHQATDDSPARGAWWATCGPVGECRAALHKQVFRLTHTLADHPLFSLDALIGVAQEAARRKHDVHMDHGSVSISDKMDAASVPDLPVWEVVKRVETAGAWIVLKHVEADARYKVVIDAFTDFVRTVAGPESARLLRNPELIVLITSPNRLTPFHIDKEINFLLQLQGAKDVWVCDPSDRTVVTAHELERFYAVNAWAPTYKPDAESRAAQFLLAPGEAIHIPSHAAHWVRNHDNVSVSLSLNFEFPSWLQGDVYRANYCLRRLGLSPRPPGQSVLADRAKGAFGAVQRKAKRAGGVLYRSARKLLRR